MYFFYFSEARNHTTWTALPRNLAAATVFYQIGPDWISQSYGKQIKSSDNCRRRMQLGRNQKSPSLLSSHLYVAIMAWQHQSWEIMGNFPRIL